MSDGTQEIRGVLAAIVTPTMDDGQLDEEALRGLVDRLIDAGVAGLVPCGSTGEFTTFSNAERRRITEVVAQAANKRAHVIPHTGAMRTGEALELSRHAESVGASAVMVVPPYYEPPPFPDIVEHFERVAQAIKIPVVYYNIPDASGLKLTAAQIGVLADVAGVRFVKNSSSDAALLQELIHTVPAVDVWNGCDTLTLFALLAGTKAVLWGAANVIPELCVELFDTIYYENDVQKARALWQRIWPICRFFESAGLSYSAVVKAGCELVGHPAGAPRSPVGELPAEQKTELAGLLAEAGVAVSAEYAGAG